VKKVLALPWYYRWPILAGTALGLATAVGLVVWVALEPYVHLHGHRLSWVDWTTVVGLAVAVIALGFTWLQVVEAKTAAEAAADAVDHALAALGKSELLLDFQSFRQLEYEFDKAEAADRQTVQRLIREVREVGARIASTLKSKNPDDELIGQIEAVRETASVARVAIMGGRKNMNLWNVTRKLREDMVPLCDAISTRMHDLRLEVEEGGAHAA
jgi:hypothetical protein